MNLCQYLCLGFLDQRDCLLALWPRLINTEDEYIDDDIYSQTSSTPGNEVSQGSLKEESPMEVISLSPVLASPKCQRATSEEDLKISNFDDSFLKT